MTEILTALEVNGLTGETIVRPLTENELADLEAMQSEIQQHQAQLEAKAKARLSALAKLKKLGLTAAEIEAL